MDAYSADVEAVLDDLDTQRQGLSSQEVENRREKYGRNEIEDQGGPSALSILIDQFKDYLIYILIIAAIISLLIGLIPGEESHYSEAAIIATIIIFNSLFGFYQDYSAEKSLQALKKMASPTATVRRDGERKEIPVEEVVPGDILILEQGDTITADARVIETAAMATEEAALTGESQQMRKSTEPVGDDLPLAERTSMVYKDTNIVKGSGEAVVTATGMDTEIGTIAEDLQAMEDEKTPFQKEVDELGRSLGKLISVFVLALAMFQGIITGTDIVTLFLLTVGLVVAAIPESLPVVVTFALSLGSRRMLEENALVRRLPVVESLGSVNNIITDKTGTLTQGTMTVRRVFDGQKDYTVTGVGTDLDGKFEHDGDAIEPADTLKEVLACGLYCNNTEQRGGEFDGDPTEVALYVAAKKAGMERENDRVREVPFSAQRKRMTVVTEDGTAYMKGAPAEVLDRCDRIKEDGEIKELTDTRREAIEQQVSTYAQEALRVLAFAKDDVKDPEIEEDELEDDMVFLGLQAMIDPPRDDVKEAIEDCRTAGITVTMATGDDLETAKAIGEELGFDPEGALTGSELEAMSDEEIQDAVENVEVFARVSPDHKVEIEEALRGQDMQVAMTGDGVNDAPALKASDVGIAMGQQGTDVAKQSSDIVLQDDNFVTIRDAIEEGRTIFDNIRKVTNYLLSTNAAEVMFVFLGALIGTFFFEDIFSGGEAVVLSAVMILWVNFITDGPPSVALAADDSVPGVMERPPKQPDEKIIDKKMLATIAGTGPLAAIVFLPLFFMHLGQSFALAQSILFTSLAMFEILMLQVVRQKYGLSFFSNKLLLGSVVLASVAQLVVLYTPVRHAFEAVPITLEHWGMIGVAVVVFTAVIMSYERLMISRLGGRRGSIVEDSD